MKNKKILSTVLTSTLILGTSVVNAANTGEMITKNQVWAITLSEIIAVLFLVFFAISLGRYITLKQDDDAKENQKKILNSRNGIVTALVGIAICKTIVIIVKLYIK